jgi:hypothetical protein
MRFPRRIIGYDGVQEPRCETCHVTIALGQDEGIEMHQQHAGDLSCQVCHSQPYTSCDGCHVQISEETGNPFFRTDDHYFTFMIGKNPRESYDRPYEWVTLRHVPVAMDSFPFTVKICCRTMMRCPHGLYHAA